MSRTERESLPPPSTVDPAPANGSRSSTRTPRTPRRPEMVRDRGADAAGADHDDGRGLAAHRASRRMERRVAARPKRRGFRSTVTACSRSCAGTRAASGARARPRAAGRVAVDDAEHSAPLIADLRDQHLNRIPGGARDRAHLRALLDRVEHV